jgi:hypothetical protein
MPAPGGSRLNRYLSCLFALLTAAAPCLAGFLPKGTSASNGCRNIVLIYNCAPGHLDWQAADFAPLLTWTSPDGRSTHPFFDAFLVLPLVAPSGRGFCPGFGTGPSNVGDWTTYLDGYLFGGRNHLKRLDLAALEARARLQARRMTWKVILTLPYPDPSQHAFGQVDMDGPNLDFTYRKDRLDACVWWIEAVLARWKSAAFQALELVGIYWVHEAVSTTEDKELLPRVASRLHASGLKFFWIPWYNAPGATTWRDYSFDAAMHQPNYFFTTTVPYQRLIDAVTLARNNGLGMELELDERVLTSSEFRQRYRAYLAVDADQGVQRGALTAWYMGASALNQAAASANPEVRAIYDETWAFVAGSGLPGDVDRTNQVTADDLRLMLAILGGARSGAEDNIDAANGDVNANGRVDLGDACRVMRFLVGLQSSP